MADEQRPSSSGADPVRIAELVERARDGSRDAWQALDEQYGPQLRATISHLLPHGEPLGSLVDSDDLLQETWKSILVSLRRGQTFRTENDFSRYIRKVAEHHVYREYRDHVSCLKRTLTRQEAFDQRRHGGLAAGADPADEAARRDEVQHFLHHLTAEQRQLLIALLTGEKLADTAATMGMSERSAERMVADLRQRWRERLAMSQCDGQDG